MKIRRFPDPVLLEKATPVMVGKEADNIVKQLIHAKSLVKWGKVVGMAAPQIGFSKQVFIVGVEAFLNPELDVTGKMFEAEEGCYSLEPSRYDYKVKRPRLIHLKWQDVNGDWHEEDFANMKAQIIHHEYQHLQGVLCNA